MDKLVFMGLAITYIVLLASVDGLFNRLVFRGKRRLPYSSRYKRAIYRRWEWKAVALIFLITLPIILPMSISYTVGGFTYVLLYLIALTIVPWDLIFGILVFDNIFGDTPSIDLPFFNWLTFSLKKTFLVRLVFLVSLLSVLYFTSSKY